MISRLVMYFSIYSLSFISYTRWNYSSYDSIVTTKTSKFIFTKMSSPFLTDFTRTVHQTPIKLLSVYNDSVQVSGIERFYILSPVHQGWHIDFKIVTI